MRLGIVLLIALAAYAEEKTPTPPVLDVKIQLRMANLEKILLRMEVDTAKIRQELFALESALEGQCGEKFMLSPQPNAKTGERECVARPPAPAPQTEQKKRK